MRDGWRVLLATLLGGGLIAPVAWAQPNVSIAHSLAGQPYASIAHSWPGQPNLSIAHSWPRQPTLSIAQSWPGNPNVSIVQSGPGEAATIPTQPLLYGVIYGGQGWVAYIEDPLTKTVAPYRVGDAVAGQTVETIEDERVLLKGPDGTTEIHLTYDKTGVRSGPSSR
jgi:hypothetical protein